MANRNDELVRQLEERGAGTRAAEVQVAPLSSGSEDLRHLGDDEVVPGLGIRAGSLEAQGGESATPGTMSRLQVLRPAEKSPAPFAGGVETLPLVPDPVEVEDVTLPVGEFSGSEEGFRALHPLNVGNVDNVVKGPGFVFNAAGQYRDFRRLDRIFAVEPGTMVPAGLYLVADRDLLAEPARSQALGRRVRTLAEAGFVPSLGVPTVESVPSAVRVAGARPTEAENAGIVRRDEGDNA
jgi:hypothetical protein